MAQGKAEKGGGKLTMVQEKAETKVMTKKGGG